jgi:hypothetical protein
LQWFFVNFGGFIFITTPLTWKMSAAAAAFGAGSLLISLLLKTMKESWVNKLTFNRIEADEGAKKVQSKKKRSKRSELERLLDED